MSDNADKQNEFPGVSLADFAVGVHETTRQRFNNLVASGNPSADTIPS